MHVQFAIPYWGSPELMRRTIASVLAQTDPGWTLLVVDDNYPDPVIGEELRALSDPRVTYVRNETNLGTTGNFQRCLDLSSGELVVFLGSDDLLGPEYVATVRAAASAYPDAAAVQPGVRVIGADGQPRTTLADEVKQRLIRPRGSGRRELSGEALAVSLLHGDWLYWPSIAFRRDRLAGLSFRPEYEVILDLALIMELVLRGDAIVVDDTVVFDYRRHDASVSSVARHSSRFADERTYFHEVAEQLTARGWRRAAAAARWHITSRLHAATLIPGALARRDGALARTLLRHATAR